MLAGLITIAGGLLAASALILKLMPNADRLIEKIVPYQGWIGTVMFCWGVWETISVVLNVGSIGEAPLHWTFWALTAVSDLGVGLLLGFGLISKYALSRNAAALARGQQLRGKLVTVQIPLGFVAMIMGALYIVL